MSFGALLNQELGTQRKEEKVPLYYFRMTEKMCLEIRC